MAFDRIKLALIGTSGVGKVYTYVTADTKATMIAANYFQTAWRDLNVGDRIFTVSATNVHTDLAVATSAVGGITVLSQANYA